MPDASDNQRPRAMLVVQNPSDATMMETCCADNGIETYTQSDPRSALEACRCEPPDLAVVQWDLRAMSGVEFITELLKISWTTATILVTDQDEETVHEKAEGLGILGRIIDFRDMVGLRKLLDIHKGIRNQAAPNTTWDPA